MSSPRSRTTPPLPGTSPVSTLNSVVLPAPLGPITANSSPGITLKLTSLRIFTAP